VCFEPGPGTCRARRARYVPDRARRAGVGFIPAGVEVDCYVAVSRLGYVGVERNGQAVGGVAEPGLDHPVVLSLLDHETGGDVPQPVEREALGQSGHRDSRPEHPLLEIATERSALGRGEYQILLAGIWLGSCFAVMCAAATRPTGGRSPAQAQR